MGIFRRSKRLALGIDIGSASVKGLELSTAGKGFKASRAGVEPLPKNAIVEHRINDLRLISDAVRRAVHHSRSSRKRVVVSVPQTHVITRTINLPAGLAEREIEEQVDQAVAAILAEVRERGDAAVIGYTERFDRLQLRPEELRFTAEEIRTAEAACSPSDLDALAQAAERITDYHRRQTPQDLDYRDGTDRPGHEGEVTLRTTSDAVLVPFLTLVDEALAMPGAPLLETNLASYERPPDSYAAEEGLRYLELELVYVVDDRPDDALRDRLSTRLAGSVFQPGEESSFDEGFIRTVLTDPLAEDWRQPVVFLDRYPGRIEITPLPDSQAEVLVRVTLEPNREPLLPLPAD